MFGVTFVVSVAYSFPIACCDSPGLLCLFEPARHGVARNCTELHGIRAAHFGYFCVFSLFFICFPSLHGNARNRTEWHGTPGARLGAPAGPSPAQPPRVASERIRNDFFGKSNGSIILFGKTMIFINLLERSMISLFFLKIMIFH